MQHSNFTVEVYAGMADQRARDLDIEEAPQNEIKYTLEHKNQSYVDLCDLSDKVQNNKKVKLYVTYDTGWQKISYGKRCDSSSGYAFIICGQSKGVIGIVLYSKAWRKFCAAENRG